MASTPPTLDSANNTLGPAAGAEVLTRLEEKKTMSMSSAPAPAPDANANADPRSPARKGAAFWLSLLAIIVCTFVSALDVTAVSTALPTITEDLRGGDEFVWVGAAYGLASTAILPLCGRLADAFGRRPVMLAVVGLFFVGSAVSGAARNMHMHIAGRTIQGIGGGGILNLTEIIISDLVPLAERGMYMGIFAFTWALASGVGPPIGGALAQAGAWRWTFYLNLPLTGVAFLLVLVFLRVRTPEGTITEKLARLDVIGNSIVIAGTTLALIGVTWGGVRYAWSDAHVLAPLIVGLVLVCLFFVYERTVPKHASIPWDIVNNRTTVSALIGTFFHGLTSAALFYYLPVYFQACHGSSPVRSSVQVLATALFVAPFAFTAGTLVQVLQQYRWINLSGWVVSIIGFGLLSTLEQDSSTGKWVGYQLIAAAGTGLLFSATIFPILAPLPVKRTAAALAFFSFSRAFSQTWGITIGSAILQNRLRKGLPPGFNELFPEGAQIAYAAIPVINDLPEPLRTQVKQAFADSLAIVWETMIGISGLGLVSVAWMREVSMVKQTDETYGLQESRSRDGSETDSRSDGERSAVQVVEKSEPV